MDEYAKRCIDQFGEIEQNDIITFDSIEGRGGSNWLVLDVTPDKPTFRIQSLDGQKNTLNYEWHSFLENRGRVIVKKGEEPRLRTHVCVLCGNGWVAKSPWPLSQCPDCENVSARPERLSAQ